MTKLDTAAPADPSVQTYGRTVVPELPPPVRSRGSLSSVTGAYLSPEVTLGRNAVVAPGAQLWGRVEVGDDVTVGPNVVISPTAYSAVKALAPAITVLANGCSIEGGAVLRQGVRVGSEAIVRAGAVVTQDVPSRAVVEGNPARIIDYVGVAPLPDLPDLHDSEAIHRADASDPFVTPLNAITDLRGGITVLESNREIPFTPARIFLVHSVPSSSLRGEHAHRICAQYCVAVAGSMRLVLDDGHERRQYLLQPFQQGVYIPPMVWGVQYKFSRDAVMMVAASHSYDAADYIRDYETWRSELA